MPIQNNLYSEETQSILGQAPSWVVRWGITVVFIIFGGVLVGCWFIKYPDIISAPVVITTINPPTDLVVRYSGLIDTLCVKDKEYVKQGERIAVLQNAAEIQDIDRLTGYLLSTDTINPASIAVGQWVYEEYALGELQSNFAEFQNCCRNYRHYLTVDNIYHRKKLLGEQIVKNREYYDKLKYQHSLLLQELDYERHAIKRDSLLMSESVISAADYEISVQNYLSKMNTNAGFDATLTSTELHTIQLEQQLIELTLQQENEIAEYERAIDQSRQQLIAHIQQWQQQYVLEAPISGCVTLVTYWSENQHIDAGNKLASIVPDGETEIIGRLQIPSTGFGKVRVGQEVNVRLSGYPYMEFGVLKGRIRSLSAVPEQLQTPSGTTIVYTAEVIFPNGMMTSYKLELPMIQRMDGTAEIITRDMRLIEQFILPIVSLFKNR